MTQYNLFDHDEARAQRDQAIALADTGAEMDWKTTALEAVRQVCIKHPTFTSDTVWRLLPTTKENRAFGPVMMRAAKLGYCTALQEWVPSARPQVHMNQIRVWRSLMWRGW